MKNKKNNETPNTDPVDDLTPVNDNPNPGETEKQEQEETEDANPDETVTQEQEQTEDANPDDSEKQEQEETEDANPDETEKQEQEAEDIEALKASCDAYLNSSFGWRHSVKLYYAIEKNPSKRIKIVNIGDCPTSRTIIHSAVKEFING